MNPFDTFDQPSGGNPFDHFDGVQQNNQSSSNSFVNNPTLSGLGQAAIGAAKDTTMMIPNTLSDIGRMVYGSDKPNAMIGPSKPIITGNVKETIGNVANLALPFMMPPAESNIAKPMDASVAETIPDLSNLNANLPRTPTYDPVKTMRATSGAFFDAIDRANTYYNLPKQMAQGQTVSAPQVKDYISSIISDVDQSPWHEAKSQVGTLQRIHDALPDGGEVPVNDLLDLRTFTNKYFNPSRMTDKSSTYGKLNSVVDIGLNTARKNIPNFGQALDVADDFWKNGVAQPFLKNKVLQRIWSPEDAHNIRMYDNGQLDNIPDITMQRANNITNKIKDVDSYNALRRTLPPDIGHTLDNTVLAKQPNSGRLQALGSTVYNTATGHFPSAFRSFGDFLNPSINPQTTDLIKAIKGQDTFSPLSQRNNLSQAQYDALNNYYQSQQKQNLFAVFNNNASRNMVQQ